jgi:hypothetical protein
MKSLALGLAIALLGASAPAQVHRDVEYGAKPLVVDGPATLVCLIDLKPGEVIAPKIVGADLLLFDPQLLVSGDQPHFTLRPDAPGRHANFILASSGRHPHLYVIIATSTKSTLPMMRVSYRYDAEDRYDRRAEENARRIAVQHAQAHATPVRLTQLQQMDAACAGNHDAYKTLDRGEFAPERVCHNTTETFVELPGSATALPDIPVLMEVDPTAGDTVADVHPEAVTDAGGTVHEVYRVMDVAKAYVLISGKKRIRIQWVPPVAEASK